MHSWISRYHIFPPQQRNLSSPMVNQASLVCKMISNRTAKVSKRQSGYIQITRNTLIYRKNIGILLDYAGDSPSFFVHRRRSDWLSPVDTPVTQKRSRSLSDLGNRSENLAGRGQILLILLGNSCSIAQKSYEIWTVQTDLQQIHTKSDRLLATQLNNRSRIHAGKDS